MLPDIEALDALERWHAAPPKPARKRRERAPDGLLTMQEAAARLGCSTKTLKGHIAAGEIGYVALGHGTKRTRKMFAPADLDSFIANQRRKESPACLSAATRARPTGTSTFRSEVIAFTARPNARPAAKPKR
jgi:excisionase family DNA binding protein